MKHKLDKDQDFCCFYIVLQEQDVFPDFEYI